MKRVHRASVAVERKPRWDYQRNQKQHLIRFTGVGSGQGIRWELVVDDDGWPMRMQVAGRFGSSGFLTTDYSSGRIPYPCFELQAGPK